MANDPLTQPLQHWHDRVVDEAARRPWNRTADCLTIPELYAIGCGLKAATSSQQSHLSECKLCKRRLGMAEEIADGADDSSVPPLLDTPEHQYPEGEAAEDDVARGVRHSRLGHEEPYAEPAVEPLSLPSPNEEARG